METRFVNPLTIFAERMHELKEFGKLSEDAISQIRDTKLRGFARISKSSYVLNERLFELFGGTPKGKVQ